MADSNEEVQARWGLKNEKEVPWDREKGLDADSAEQYRAAILEFISNSKESSAYLMTRRKDGREIMRPVSVLLIIGYVKQLLKISSQKQHMLEMMP